MFDKLLHTQIKSKAGWLILAIVFAVVVVAGLLLLRQFVFSKNGFQNDDQPIHAASFEKYVETVNILLSNPDSAMQIAQNMLEQTGSDSISAELIPYYNILGIYYRNQAMYDKSIATSYAYLEYALTYNLQQHIAEAYENIGMVNFLTYRYKDALGMMLKSLEIYEQLGDKLKVAWIFNSIGRVYYEIGDIEKARKYYHMANDIFAGENFHLGISSVSNHMAKYYLQAGHPDSAFYFINKAITHALSTGNNYGLSNIFLEKGNIFLQTGNLSEAIRNFSVSDSLAAYLNFSPLKVLPKLALAEAYILLEQFDIAEINLRQAARLASLNKSDKLLYKLNDVFAQLHEKSGDTAQAYKFYKNANTHKNNMINQSETFQVYNIEIEQLSSKMEMQDMEMRRQAMLLAQRKNTMVLIVVVSLSVILLLSLLYYFYLSRLRQAEKEKMHRQQLKYSTEKNQAVLEAEINERKRLASEMHDGIGTQLSLVKLTLSNIIGRPGLAGERKEHLLKTTMSSIDDIIREVKSISDSMTPQALAEKGLKEALKELVAKYAQIRSYKIKLSIVGLNRAIKPVASHAIFRTVQELMANALKHAAGSEISLQILQNDDDLLIMIEDNGKGFEVDQQQNKNNFGLKNARSRVESLNGQLLIDSMTKRGTIITITIPAGDVFIQTETPKNQGNEKNKSLHY